VGAGQNGQPQALEAALALWRGEPLEASDFAWTAGHIHRLRATLVGPLERAGNARLERGDGAGALELAEQPSRSSTEHGWPGSSTSLEGRSFTSSSGAWSRSR